MGDSEALTGSFGSFRKLDFFSGGKKKHRGWHGGEVERELTLPAATTSLAPSFLPKAQPPEVPGPS